LSVSPVPAIAEGISPVGNAAGDLVNYILGYGVLGVAAVLFALGYIIPKPVLAGAQKERDQWQKAYEDERTAHATTRESLAVANDRAEAAVEAARVTTKLLEVVQRREP
jgi:hypothetical protein